MAPLTVALRRWRLARRKWCLEIDDDHVTVDAPMLKRPWTIPLAAVAGVCDPSARASPPDDLALKHPPRVLRMQTKGNVAKANLSITLKPAQPLPALRFAYYLGNGVRRRDVKTSSAPVDGFAVAAEDSAAATNALETRGIRRFPSLRLALIDAIGAVPMAALPDAERDRLRRAAKLRRWLRIVDLTLLVMVVLVRLAFLGSSLSRLDWFAIGTVCVLVAIHLVLFRMVRRESRQPLDVHR